MWSSLVTWSLVTTHIKYQLKRKFLSSMSLFSRILWNTHLIFKNCNLIFRFVSNGMVLNFPPKHFDIKRICSIEKIWKNVMILLHNNNISYIFWVLNAIFPQLAEFCKKLGSIFKIISSVTNQNQNRKIWFCSIVILYFCHYFLCRQSKPEQKNLILFNSNLALKKAPFYP